MKYDEETTERGTQDMTRISSDEEGEDVSRTKKQSKKKPKRQTKKRTVSGSISKKKKPSTIRKGDLARPGRISRALRSIVTAKRMESSDEKRLRMTAGALNQCRRSLVDATFALIRNTACLVKMGDKATLMPKHVVVGMKMCRNGINTDVNTEISGKRKAKKDYLERRLFSLEDELSKCDDENADSVMRLYNDTKRKLSSARSHKKSRKRSANKDTEENMEEDKDAVQEEDEFDDVDSTAEKTRRHSKK